MRSIRLPYKPAKELNDALDELARTPAGAAIEPLQRVIALMDKALELPRSVKAARKRAKAKKQSKREAWAEIVEQVRERSGGRCERLDGYDERCPRPAVDPAHAFGGKDRLSMQSKYTVRHLCRECHDWEHANPAEAIHDFMRWAAVKRAMTDERGYSDAVYEGHKKYQRLKTKAALPAAPSVRRRQSGEEDTSRQENP